MEALLLAAEVQRAGGAPEQALASTLAASRRGEALQLDGLAAEAAVAAAASWLALGATLPLSTNVIQAIASSCGEF